MKILGTGSYLPADVVTNEALTHLVDTSDEWIIERTGICERRISRGEENSEQAIKAARCALEDSGLSPEDIGLIIVATVTSDYVTPSMACIVQEALGIPKAIAFDINAACAGFMYAMNTARCFLANGMVKNALIIGSETLSKITDYTDRQTCVLFADASGAAVVQRDENEQFWTELGADGTKHDVIHCKHKPMNNCLVEGKDELDYIHMEGREVYKFVVKEIPLLIKRVIEKSGIDIANIKYFILHQANKRMNEMIAKKLGVSFDKFPCNIEKMGNTSAASVPVLLDEINKKGMLQSGDYVLLSSFGAGMTWAASLFQWKC